MLEILTNVTWNDLLDMMIVYYITYRILIFIRGTRSIQMAMGLGVIVLVFAVSYFLKLYTLQWLISNFIDVVIIVIIIIFSEDIRRALTKVGKTPFLKTMSHVSGSRAVDEIIKAVVTLANKRIGALIVIERETGLKNYLEIGTEIDSNVKSALICSIFTSKDSHIHDGAIIIQDGRITAAGCFLPLTLRPEVPKEIGTRHRAALGITEETDAIAIVVSEEKGHISVVMGGKMIRDLTRSDLTKLLGYLFSVKGRKNDNLYDIFESLREIEEKA